MNGGVDSVKISDELIGIFYSSAADRPRPVAILLHGVPGSEKNVDIAYRLRDLGWHTLIVFFSGAWGSGGNYDMTAQPAQAIQALEYILTPDPRWQIDPSTVVLVGYSLGSRAAIVAAGRDPRVNGVVSLSGIAEFDEIMLSDEFWTEAAPFLHGTDAQKLAQQWRKLGGTEDPARVIGTLTCPVLLVHGTADEVVPSYMADVLHNECQQATFSTIQGSDHTFTHHRTQLVDIVTGWLTELYQTRQGDRENS